MVVTRTSLLLARNHRPREVTGTPHRDLPASFAVEPLQFAGRRSRWSDRLEACAADTDAGTSERMRPLAPRRECSFCGGAAAASRSGEPPLCRFGSASEGEREARAGWDHGSSAGVDGFDDLAGVDPLEVDRGHVARPTQQRRSLRARIESAPDTRAPSCPRPRMHQATPAGATCTTRPAPAVATN